MSSSPCPACLYGFVAGPLVFREVPAAAIDPDVAGGSGEAGGSGTNSAPPAAGGAIMLGAPVTSLPGPSPSPQSGRSPPGPTTPRGWVSPPPRRAT